MDQLHSQVGSIVAVKDKADRDMYQYKYDTEKSQWYGVRTCTIAIFYPDIIIISKKGKRIMYFEYGEKEI